MNDPQILKFGKPNADVLELKHSFIDGNSALKLDQSRVNEVYRAQPERKGCKNCEHPLGAAALVKEAIAYYLCARCGHLNGAHEETTAFCAAVYTDDYEEQYAGKYRSEDITAFRTRTKTIYTPKVEFLLSALHRFASDPRALSFADLGAGSGYMVAALHDAGARHAMGYEVSTSQIRFGNEMIGCDALLPHGLAETPEVAARLDAEVVTMIGTLEHFLDPRAVLQGLSENPRVSYVFFSVPLFSATVFFELMLPQVQQAQLGGRHTHLYTESSIDWFCREYGLERIAEWWFGSDFLHLFRHLSVRIAQQGQPEDLARLWDDAFVPAIDSVQMGLDEKKLSSEVHMLVRKTR